jgi:probable HAF family extracellular repeat protein
VGLAAIALVAWFGLRAKALYTVTMLPSLHGYAMYPHAINDHGQIVVAASSPRGDHLFLWDRENGMRDLGPATGGRLDINNSGDIAGTMVDIKGNKQAFLWEPGKGRTMLGTLGGDMSITLAMNNRSQVVGISTDAADSVRLFLWNRATGMKELERPEPRGFVPFGLDDKGRTLVASAPGTSQRWYLLGPDGPALVDDVPPDICMVSLNNKGYMAGTVEESGKEPYLALWRRGEAMRRLSSVSGHAQMTRLNDQNQVAWTNFCARRWERWRERLHGPRMMTDASVSYLWDPARGKIPLDRYVGDFERFLVQDLNNHGCLVGWAYTKDRQRLAVLLEPIPERWEE